MTVAMAFRRAASAPGQPRGSLHSLVSPSVRDRLCKMFESTWRAGSPPNAAPTSACACVGPLSQIHDAQTARVALPAGSPRQRPQVRVRLLARS